MCKTLEWTAAAILLVVIACPLAAGAGVHQAGDRRVEVTKRDQNLFFTRRQGVSIKVDPKRKWWCVWLCTTTTKVDGISGSIGLTGPGGEASAEGSCDDCGSKDVMGPRFWGFNVPRAYDRVSYRVLIRDDGQSFSFSGTELWQ